MPETVLGEIAKITGSDPVTTMTHVYQYCKQPIMIDRTDEIITESDKLSQKYYECHTPDNFILATAKLMGSTLVSFDRDLLQTAKNGRRSGILTKKLHQMGLNNVYDERTST